MASHFPFEYPQLHTSLSWMYWNIGIKHFLAFSGYCLLNSCRFFYIDELCTQIKDRKHWITHTQNLTSTEAELQYIQDICSRSMFAVCYITCEWCALLQGYYQDEAWTIRHKISLGKKNVCTLRNETLKINNNYWPHK